MGTLIRGLIHGTLCYLRKGELSGNSGAQQRHGEIVRQRTIGDNLLLWPPAWIATDTFVHGLENSTAPRVVEKERRGSGHLSPLSTRTTETRRYFTYTHGHARERVCASHETFEQSYVCVCICMNRRRTRERKTVNECGRHLHPHDSLKFKWYLRGSTTTTTTTKKKKKMILLDRVCVRRNRTVYASEIDCDTPWKRRGALHIHMLIGR